MLVGLDQFTQLAVGLDHPEGVAWGQDGNLYAGGELGQIYRVSLDGSVEEVARTGGFILGVALDADGRVYACDLAKHTVWRIEPETGSVEPYSTGTPEQPMHSPNFSTFDAAGNLYVSASGPWEEHTGRIYRIAPGGDTTVWSSALPHYTNGSSFNAERDVLYVAESLLPGVSRVPIQPDGSAGAPELFAELAGAIPDGLAFDTDANLYVSCYRPDRIYRIAPDGKVKVLVDEPKGMRLCAPTNIAFAGPELDRLVVANVGLSHLAVADIGVKGLALEYPTVEG